MNEFSLRVAREIVSSYRLCIDTSFSMTAPILDEHDVNKVHFSARS